MTAHPGVDWQRYGELSDRPVPDWLRPVADVLDSLRPGDFTGFRPPPDARPRRGAVLMLFAHGEQGPELLLTERSHSMRSHPGQVSFPGGGIDPGESPEQAALREAWEEIGLDPDGVELVGRLPELWLPPSNYAVVPVLGWCGVDEPVGVRSPDEVHAVHRVSIAELTDPRWRTTVVGPSGWSSPGFLIGEGHDVVLWGFTGGIVARLLDRVGWSRPWDESRETPLPPYMLGGVERASDRRGDRRADDAAVAPDDEDGRAPQERLWPMADIEESDG